MSVSPSTRSVGRTSNAVAASARTASALLRVYRVTAPAPATVNAAPGSSAITASALRADRMAAPAPATLSAVAAPSGEAAGMAPALSLVFSRLLLHATPTTLPPAAPQTRAATVSQKLLPIKRTAGVTSLLLSVQRPATVLLYRESCSSANRLGTRAFVLRR